MIFVVQLYFEKIPTRVFLLRKHQLMFKIKNKTTAHAKHGVITYSKYTYIYHTIIAVYSNYYESSRFSFWIDCTLRLRVNSFAHICTVTHYRILVSRQHYKTGTILHIPQIHSLSTK